MRASTGRQAAKKTNFLWDINRGLPQIALEQDGNNGLLRRYLYGARRVWMAVDNKTYYFANDPLGQVIGSGKLRDHCRRWRSCGQ